MSGLGWWGKKLAGAATPQRQLLNANEVIHDVSTTELEKGGVRLQLELATDLPAVLGDRIQLSLCRQETVPDE
jgi:hypothetical protein